jgi:CubicO group peptidase (beta-lactamase class C family)
MAPAYTGSELAAPDRSMSFRADCPHSVAYSHSGRQPASTLLAALLLIAACGAGDPAADPDAAVAGPDADGADPWAEVKAAVDAHEIPDLTLLVGDATGTVLVYEKGASTADTEYRIASATKWITAATIMRLVEGGTLSLSDHPQDYLTFWTDDAGDPRSQITLEQLLSFTSGFRGRPGLVPCVRDEGSSLAACVPEIYADFFQYQPGTTFFYGPAHMHTAGRMAEVATGDDWPTVVASEIGEPLGIADTVSWALAGPDHPMPSGGMRTSGASYGRFLQAIAAGEILATSDAVMAEPRTSDLTIGYSPIEPTIGAWTYGLGQWRECDAQSWSATCDADQISSSPGAFGFYPWYDRVRGYWAIIATELPLSATNPPTDRTVPLGQQLQPLIASVLASP